MIIVRLIGGLGNQMFQYSAGFALSKIKDVELKIDIISFEEYKLHKFSLQHLNIQSDIASINEIENSSPMKEKHFHFDNLFFDIKDNSYLIGYWQSEKYFKKYSNDLVSHLSVNKKIFGKNKILYDSILASNSIAVHIRRGDYNSKTYADQIFDNCSLDYYYKCVEQLSIKIENPNFFIFSDDPEWVRKNFKIKYPFQIIDHNNADTNFEDLRLMYSCDHNIISNSSFSWWAAWMNQNPNKIVYAPLKWFNSNNRNLNPKDLVPNSWISL